MTDTISEAHFFNFLSILLAHEPICSVWFFFFFKCSSFVFFFYFFDGLYYILIAKHIMMAICPSKYLHVKGWVAGYFLRNQIKRQLRQTLLRTYLSLLVAWWWNFFPCHINFMNSYLSCEIINLFPHYWWNLKLLSISVSDTFILYLFCLNSLESFTLHHIPIWIS